MYSVADGILISIFNYFCRENKTWHFIRTGKVLQMSTHNVCFSEDLEKSIQELSPNTPLETMSVFMEKYEN